DVGQQHSRFARLLPHLAADDAFFLPARVMRRHLALDEALDARAEERVVLAKQRLHVHGAFPLGIVFAMVAPRAVSSSENNGLVDANRGGWQPLPRVSTREK